MISSWKEVSHVIFDWNGTLIDDLDLAIESVNRCCDVYDVDKISKEKYRKNFKFPIEEFYNAIGFDTDAVPFSKIIDTYLANFNEKIKYASLHSGVYEFFDFLHRQGTVISILSASHTSILYNTISSMKLDGFISHCIGLDDEKAKGKLERAQHLSTLTDIPRNKTLFIGDTLHDAELAETLGWQGCLLSCGHQHETYLSDTPFPLLIGIEELFEKFLMSTGAKNNVSSLLEP